MMGPMLLHWDENFDSYHKFTLHIQAKLIDTDQSNLIWGSDEESALFKAMASSFPLATRLLCAKHLKDNTPDNLSKSLPQSEVTTILHRLIDADDILSSTDERTFDEIGSELTDRYDLPCLKNRLLLNLWQNVFEPRLQHPLLPMLLYNNCNESLNNVIKRKINREIQKLPGLIGKLHELEQDQIRDIRDALHDTGKYSLSQSACILKVSHETWLQLTPDQRSRRVQKFLNYRPKQTDIISSTDG